MKRCEILELSLPLDKLSKGRHLKVITHEFGLIPVEVRGYIETIGVECVTRNSMGIISYEDTNSVLMPNATVTLTDRAVFIAERYLFQLGM